MNETEISYWAGVIDSDGSVSLALSISRTQSKSILVTPHIRIGWKQIYDKTLIDARNYFDLGKIYYSNKDTPDGFVSWQTTNLHDAIKLAKLVLPYLKIKKERTQRFLEVTEYWLKTCKIGGKTIGERVRKKEDMIWMVKTAITLNEGRQTERWRSWRGWDYWEPIIDEMYEKQNNKDVYRQNRRCVKCDSATTYTDKKGGERWYKYDDGFICDSCKSKQRRQIQKYS